MTNVSELLIPGGNSGQFLTDPRDMRRYMAQNLYFWKRSGGAFEWASNFEIDDAPYFWDTLMAQDGAAITSTAWSADTYKTVLDVTGRGFLYNVLGPIWPVANNLFTARVTVDGFPYVISGTVKDSNTSRLVLGAIDQQGANSNAELQGESYARIWGWSSKLASRNTEGVNYQGFGYLLEENRLHEMGQVLKFNASVKVEIKSQAAIAVDASARRQHYAGVRYLLAN